MILFTKEPYSESDNKLIKRFAKVFEQAYVRFLDLQKAEDQAREAQIEAALERVRAKAMAMHKSEDVSLATESLFDHVSSLGIETQRCGIAIPSNSFAKCLCCLEQKEGTAMLYLERQGSS